MPDFFQTRMGQTFYDGTMPRLARAAEKIAVALERRTAGDALVARLAAMRTTAEVATAEGADVTPGSDDALQALMGLDTPDAVRALARRLDDVIRDARAVLRGREKEVL